MNPKQAIKQALTKTTQQNSQETDNYIKEIQTDAAMRAIRFDIRQNGSIRGYKIA